MNLNRPDVRTLRATSTVARSLYRELRRADYSREDVLRLVNEMMELLTQDARGGNGVPRVQPTVDREIGLPNASVMGEVLEFELAHARDGLDLLVVGLEVELPSLLPDPVCHSVHESVAQVLRRQVRSGETVGRLAVARYLIVLPRAALEVVHPLLRRLGAAFAHAEAIRDPQNGVRIVARAAAHDASVASVAELLDRCGRAPAIPVYPAPLAAGTGTVQIKGGELRVVLALGGGAARAMAHLGVLRALRRAGIKIAGVAGTSAGAIIGALHAAGVEDEALVARFTELPRSEVYRAIRSAYARHRPRLEARKNRERFFRGSSLSFLSESERSALGDDMLAAFVEHLVGPDRLIQSLPLPFVATATDLVSGRQIALSYGSLHSALRASCAIPGLFPPQADGDRLLVDGSVIAEVPIAAAAQLGLRAPVLAAYLERAVPPVDRYASSTEIAIRTNALVHMQLVREQLRAAPFLLSIPVDDVGWLSFREAKKLIEVGERAAAAALPALVERLERVAVIPAGAAPTPGP